MGLNRRDYLGVSFFVRPLPLFTLFLLALNDHFLKANFGSWWTGKLSDFAGLFFFPLFLCALWVLFARHVLRRRDEWLSERSVLIAILLTDLIFVMIKISERAADFAAGLLGAAGFPSRIIADPTDLVALSISPLVYLYARAIIAVERR